MKKIHKFRGEVEVSNAEHIEALIKDEKSINRIVKYILASTYSGKDDPEVEAMVKNYAMGMLEYAKY